MLMIITMNRYLWRRFFWCALSTFLIVDYLRLGINAHASASFDTTREPSTPLKTHSHVFMEASKHNIRPDITIYSRAPKTNLHSVEFVIQQRNIRELIEVLHDVSDPNSEHYGHHWTKKEIVDFTANPEGHVAVISYLKQQDSVEILDEKLYGEFITARAPVSTWESIFKTEFFIFQMKGLFVEAPMKDNKFIRSKDYSLPVELVGHVSAVFNTIDLPDMTPPQTLHVHPKEFQPNFKRNLEPRFDQMDQEKEIDVNQQTQSRHQSDSKHSHSSRNVFTTLSSNSSNTSRVEADGLWFPYVTPAFLKKHYNISNSTGSTAVTQAVVESSGHAVSPADLRTFQQYFRLLVQPIANVTGGYASNDACNSSAYNGCFERYVVNKNIKNICF